MGGKKPVGDHPSRGSYFRRLHTGRGGHHTSDAPQDHCHQPHCSLDSEGDVPTYQDFSLFSAFSSSNRFGGILSANTDSADTETDTGPGNFDRSSHSTVGGVTMLHQAQQREEHGAAQYTALLAQNSRLESAVQQLQEHVMYLSQAMERLSYEHGVVVQQTQQSWQFMYAQLCAHGVSGVSSPPIQRVPAGKVGDKAVASSTAPAPSRKEGEDGVEAEVAEELRRLKERLCTVEGRHKMVQGKVSQLDKLYGTTSAAWGRRIKSLLPSPTAPAFSSGHDDDDDNDDGSRGSSGGRGGEITASGCRDKQHTVHEATASTSATDGRAAISVTDTDTADSVTPAPGKSQTH